MSDEPSYRAAGPAARGRFSLLDRWFRPVHVPRAAASDLADLARRGHVVFVMRSAGLLNLLFLSWFMRGAGLPRLRTAVGLSPLLAWLAGARAAPDALEQALAAGESAMVFLGRSRAPDPFPLLLAAQRRAARPIFLVPAILVWTRRPQRLKPSVGDLLFGTPEAPSRFANGIGFLLNHRRAVLQLGRASDVSAFLAARASAKDDVLARLVRGALHLHLARQVRTIVGPPLKTLARTRDQVLRDRGLRATIESEAHHTGRPREALQRQAERDFREIASRFSPAFIEIVRPILSWIFGRTYDAVEIDQEGLARVKEAGVGAPIVFCPSHKSYVDFLVLPWALSQNGMTPPLAAAGINLQFWPFGTIARWGGAFFIRRSLRGDKLYTATLRAYVKQLLRDRFPQEFYLEGGRSRSGKLLFPKTGLFSMEVDAWLDGAAQDVLFVPVAIDYERLMEGRSYARELAGGQKPKEDLRGLLRAGKVLGRRYGRLTVQFERPVSLRALAESRLGERAQSLTLDEVMAPMDAPLSSPPAPAGADGCEVESAADHARRSKRELVQALANHVAYGISQAITVTPVGLLATSLLSHVKPALGAAELSTRVELLRRAAEGARFSRGLRDAPSDPLRPGPIGDALTALAEGGLVRVGSEAGAPIYEAVEERRPLLDYQKNAVLHRFVPLALVSVTLRASGGAAAIAQAREDTRWLSRLFKLEFMYRVGATAEEIFEENVARLERLQVARRTDGTLAAGPDRASLEFLADLLRPYLEAYLVTVQALLRIDRAAPGAAVDRKGLVKAAMEHGRAAYATGHIALVESISKATFSNAVEWLFLQGALDRAEGGRSRVAPPWRDSGLPELERRLLVCLGHDGVAQARATG